MRTYRTTPIVCAAIGLGLTLFIHACSIRPLKTATRPLGPEDIERCVQAFHEQERRVDRFFSSGRVLLSEGETQTEAHVLIAGERHPLRMKIEITHFWGRPLLHALIHDGRMDVLSFTEKRLYKLPLGAKNPLKMLPPTVDASELWGLMRGYPTLRQYVKAVSPEASQIVFLDGAGKTVQIIERCPGGMLPCSVTFPKEASQIYFSDYQQEQGIVYARRVALHGQDRQKGMEFHVKKMTFNEPIPEDIFKLQVMAGFEIISVSE